MPLPVIAAAIARGAAVAARVAVTAARSAVPAAARAAATAGRAAVSAGRGAGRLLTTGGRRVVAAARRGGGAFAQRAQQAMRTAGRSARTAQGAVRAARGGNYSRAIKLAAQSARQARRIVPTFPGLPGGPAPSGSGSGSGQNTGAGNNQPRPPGGNGGGSPNPNPGPGNQQPSYIPALEALASFVAVIQTVVARIRLITDPLGESTRRVTEFPFRLREFSEGLLQARRTLADFSGRVAGSFTTLEAGRFRRAVQAARAQGPSASRLAASQNKLEDALAPLINTMSSATANLTSLLIELIVPPLRVVSATAETAQKWLSAPWVKIFGKEQEKLPPIEEILKRIGRGEVERERPPIKDREEKK